MGDELDDAVVRRLVEVGEGLRAGGSVKGAVMRQVMEMSMGRSGTVARGRRGGRGWTIGGVVGVAAAVMVVAWVWHTQGADGARAAYAAAIGQVERARTFSCRQVVRDVDEAGQVESHETRMMFEEPDKARVEYGSWFNKDGQVIVTDYSARRQLVMFTGTKTARVEDVRSMYDMDEKTGRLRPSVLHTETRDHILKMAGEAVTDAGEERIGGRPARVLKSAGKGGLTKTVWVDEQSGAPVQVKLEWKGRPGSFAYYDIRIDQPLDEALFSTQPPAGYAVLPAYEIAKPDAKDHVMRVMIKIRHLLMACNMYANDHGGNWPAKLEDLVGVNGITAGSLRVMLSGASDDGGAAAIVYRPPGAGKYPGGEDIVMYEAEGSRVDGKVAAGFGDGHGQVMTAEEFAKAMGN